MVGFDPNNLFKNGNGVVDQSDLTTFVNLSVSIPKRIIDVLPSASDAGITYQDSIMDGVKGQDTDQEAHMGTSYVDISFTNEDDGAKKNKELFGVTGIDIDFDTSFHPLVTIKFTDIKGSALFNQSEILSLNKDRANISEEVFFGALFHFPYPTFKLTVKGYYGDKITFALKVRNFDAAFDSNSGNYDVTVDFIGDKYGILTDIPMSLLYVAPLEYREKKGQTAEGTYVKNVWKTNEKFKNITETKNGETQSKTMPTLYEFKSLYENLIKSNNKQLTEDEKNTLKLVQRKKIAEESKSSARIINAAIDNVKSDFNTLIKLIKNGTINGDVITCSGGELGSTEIRFLKDSTNNSYIVKEENGEYYNTILGRFFENINEIKGNQDNINDAGIKDKIERFTNKCYEGSLTDYYEIKGWSTNDGKYWQNGFNPHIEITDVPDNDLVTFIESLGGNFASKNSLGGGQHDFTRFIHTHAINKRGFDFEFNSLNESKVEFFNVKESGNKKPSPLLQAIEYEVKNRDVDGVAAMHTNEYYHGLLINFKKNGNRYERVPSKFNHLGGVSITRGNEDVECEKFKTTFEYIQKKYISFKERCSNTKFYEIPMEFTLGDIKVSTTVNNEPTNRELRESFEKLYKSKFGFVPTLKNITEIVFGHIDFMGEIYLKNTVYSGIIGTTGRNYKAFPNSITTDYTDDMVTKITENGDKITYTPPFPMLSERGENGVLKRLYPKSSKENNKWAMKEREYIDNIAQSLLYTIKKIEENSYVQNASSISFTRVLPSDLLLTKNPYLSSDLNSTPQMAAAHIVKVMMYRAGNDFFFGRYTNFSNFLGNDAPNIISAIRYIRNANNNFINTINDYKNKSDIWSKYIDNTYVLTNYNKDVANADKTDLTIWIRQIYPNNIFFLSVENVNRMLNGNTAKEYSEQFRYKNNEESRCVIGEDKPTFQVKAKIPDTSENSYTSTSYEFTKKDGNIYTINKENFKNGKGDILEIKEENVAKCVVGAIFLLSSNKDKLEAYMHKEDEGSIVIRNKCKDDTNDTFYSLYETTAYWVLKIGASEWWYETFGEKVGFYGDEVSLTTSIEDDNKCKDIIEVFKSWATSKNDVVNIHGVTSVKTLKTYCDNITNDNDKITFTYKQEGTTTNERKQSIYLEKMYMLNLSWDRSCDVNNYNNINTAHQEDVGDILKTIKDIKNENELAQTIENQTQLLNELKNNLYYSIKNIGDKYMYDIAKYGLFNKEKNTSICNMSNVEIVDSFMNDISDESWIDVTTLYDLILESIQSVPSMSVMQFLSKLAENNRYNLITLPYRNIKKTDEDGGEVMAEDAWDSVFSPKPWGKFSTDNNVDTKYIFIKYNEDAHICGGEFTVDTIENENDGEKNTFIVNFGMQNNNLFKSISMNMQDSINTEESIANTLNISISGSASNPKTRQTSTAMNLFDIYKHRSYKVSIDMMGTPNITPLMFFYLKNIPMYSGKYRIIKVSHRITPNDFSTSLVGVKMSKYLPPEDGRTSSLYSMIQILSGKSVDYDKLSTTNTLNNGGSAPIPSGCSDDSILGAGSAKNIKIKFFECYGEKFTPIHVRTSVTLSKLKQRNGLYPVSIRQYNPGNIIKTSAKWAGEVASEERDNKAFKRFKNAIIGYFHIFALLYRYNAGGIKQIKDIIYRWCPCAPAGNGLAEQPPSGTYNYICRAMAHTNKGANDELDINSKDDMINIATCKTRVEGGPIDINQKIYDDNFVLVENGGTKTIKDAMESAWDMYLKYGQDSEKVKDVNFNLEE